MNLTILSIIHCKKKQKIHRKVTNGEIFLSLRRTLLAAPGMMSRTSRGYEDPWLGTIDLDVNRLAAA